MLAAEDQTNSISGPVLLIVLIAGGVIYSFGYLRAVMHRANSDYQKTKAAVKPLRKGFWVAWLHALRAGAIVTVALMLMVAWFVRDTRRADGEPAPKPSPSVQVRKAGR